MLEKELEIKDVRRMSNEESNRLTKECICTAFLFLLADNDFDKITITELINKAGVSRATFYRNYGTKETVVKDIAHEVTLKLQDVLSDSLFKENPKEWLINCFLDARKNSKIYKCLLKAGISNLELFNISHVQIANQPLSKSEKYQLIGFISALLSIIYSWISTNMVESEEEMATTALSFLKTQPL